MSQSSGKYKHWINELVCSWLSTLKGRSLRILETCQGIGDATEKYRLYGYVVAFEKKRDVYEEVCKRFRDAYSIDDCLRNQSFMNLAERYYEYAKRYPVFLPRHAMDAQVGMEILMNYNQKFDVIDVDPFGSPDPFFPGAFNLLDDKSILFVTSGEMYITRYGGFQATQKMMSRYKIQKDPSLKWARTLFRKRSVDLIAIRIMEMALSKDIALHPIFIYDYYKLPFSGVQRMGFYAHRINVLKKLRVRQYSHLDFVLGVRKLRCKQLTSTSPNNWKTDIPCRFGDEDFEEQIQDAILQRLNLLARSK